MRFIPKTYNLFDNMFDDFFNDPDLKTSRSIGLKTDIVEKDDKYQLQIEVPGFKKEDISIKLENGYLIINARSNNEKEEKDDQGNIIRRERHTGSMSRSYYVGSNLTSDDISAACNDGVLEIELAKKEETKEIESKTIEIK